MVERLTNFVSKLALLNQNKKFIMLELGQSCGAIKFIKNHSNAKISKQFVSLVQKKKFRYQNPKF